MCRNLTLREYYKHYGVLRGLISALSGLLPLISTLPLGQASARIFPPLGDFGLQAKIISLILAAGVTYLVFYKRNLAFMSTEAGRFSRLQFQSRLATVGAVFYFGSQFFFVVPINNLNFPEPNVVSIGFELKDRARQGISQGKKVRDMLADDGGNEAAIQGLWTARSILAARLSLLFSYWMMLFSFVHFVSLGVLYDACPATEV